MTMMSAPPQGSGYEIMVTKLSSSVGDEAFIAAVMKKKASATVSKIIILTKNELLRHYSHKRTLRCLTYSSAAL